MSSTQGGAGSGSEDAPVWDPRRVAASRRERARRSVRGGRAKWREATVSTPRHGLPASMSGPPLGGRASLKDAGRGGGEPDRVLLPVGDQVDHLEHRLRARPRRRSADATVDRDWPCSCTTRRRPVRSRPRRCCRTSSKRSDYGSPVRSGSSVAAPDDPASAGLTARGSAGPATGTPRRRSAGARGSRHGGRRENRGVVASDDERQLRQVQPSRLGGQGPQQVRSVAEPLPAVLDEEGGFGTVVLESDHAHRDDVVATSVGQHQLNRTRSPARPWHRVGQEERRARATTLSLQSREVRPLESR